MRPCQDHQQPLPLCHQSSYQFTLVHLPYLRDHWQAFPLHPLIRTLLHLINLVFSVQDAIMID